MKIDGRSDDRIVRAANVAAEIDAGGMAVAESMGLFKELV
jgi:hypothetical protein